FSGQCSSSTISQPNISRYHATDRSRSVTVRPACSSALINPMLVSFSIHIVCAPYRERGRSPATLPRSVSGLRSHVRPAPRLLKKGRDLWLHLQDHLLAVD